jgi:hypothetical protein
VVAIPCQWSAERRMFSGLLFLSPLDFIVLSCFIKIKLMKDKELWSKLLHIAITILTAIATTFGVTSCI